MPLLDCGPGFLKWFRSRVIAQNSGERKKSLTMVHGKGTLSAEEHQRMTQSMQQRSGLYLAFGWYYYYVISAGG
jgi:hypothetical protein